MNTKHHHFTIPIMLGSILLSSCTTTMLGSPAGNDWNPVPIATGDKPETYLSGALSRGDCNTEGSIQDWHAQAGFTLVKGSSSEYSQLQCSLALRGYYNWVSFGKEYYLSNATTSGQQSIDMKSTSYGGTGQIGLAWLLGDPNYGRFLLAIDTVYSLELGDWVADRKKLTELEDAAIENLSASGNSLDIYPGVGFSIRQGAETVTAIAGLGYYYPDLLRNDSNDPLFLTARLSLMVQGPRYFIWIATESIMGWDGKQVLKGGVGLKL